MKKKFLRCGAALGFAFLFGSSAMAQVTLLAQAPQARIVPDAGARLEVPPIDRPHPRLFAGPEEITEMRERFAAEREPWRSAGEMLIERANSALGMQASPYTGPNSREFIDHAVGQGLRAAELALAATLTDEAHYAQTAKKLLLAWATASPAPGTAFDPEIRFPNSAMDLARGMISMLKAYDLLMAIDAFSEAEAETMKAWFRDLVPVIMEGKERWELPARRVGPTQWVNDPAGQPYFGRQFYQNHLVAHTLGLLMIGVALGDRDLVQFALDSEENTRDLKDLIEGLVLMPGDEVFAGEDPDWPAPQAGEIIDRYRHVEGHGLAYATLSKNLLLFCAEVAWHNGIDFYSYTAPGGENIALPYQFYAEFVRTGNTAFKGGFYEGETVSDKARYGWVGAYEVAVRRYPDNREILDVIREVDRRAIPRHHHGYFYHASLTHGIELP